jgi:transcription-repair coupling factor (superfamily II helicase)
VYKTAADTVSLPRPSTRRVGGEPMRDTQLLEWAAELLKTVLGEPASLRPATSTP